MCASSFVVSRIHARVKEGHVQPNLLVVPERELARAVLTNSWRGSTLIRRVVEDLGVVVQSDCERNLIAVDGTYALDAMEAKVEDGRVTERETDPLSTTVVERK